MLSEDEIRQAVRDAGLNFTAPDIKVARSVERAVLAKLPAQQAPPTESYVQTVPDKCDRIVWRNTYYHLPLKIPPDADREIASLRADLETYMQAANTEAREGDIAREEANGLRAEVARLREALAAMVLEHDAGGITLATMREARALADSATTGEEGRDV